MAYGEEMVEKKMFARPFDFTGHLTKGWVVVEPVGYESDEALKIWVQRRVEFVLSLPPK